MRLLLLNPNSTASMTDTLANAALQVVNANTSLVPLTAEYGPESIEGYYDEVFSIPPMLELIAREVDNRAVDGVVVGCFDDTGIDAARCLIDAPVIGICQAAMQTAATLAGSFSVVTTLARSVPALEHLAAKYGHERSCRRVRACEVPVLALEDSSGEALEKIRKEVQLAVNEDGAEAVVLGCAGMVNLTRQLTEEVGIPVIEGVCVAVKWMEALASLGLQTSKRGGYAPARKKLYRCEFSRFAPGSNG